MGVYRLGTCHIFHMILHLQLYKTGVVITVETGAIELKFVKKREKY